GAANGGGGRGRIVVRVAVVVQEHCARAQQDLHLGGKRAGRGVARRQVDRRAGREVAEQRIIAAVVRGEVAGHGGDQVRAAGLGECQSVRGAGGVVDFGLHLCSRSG